MRVHIIRADGIEEFIDISFPAIAARIGAKTLDTVNLRDGRVMLVDDAGWDTRCVDGGGGHFRMEPVRALRPINQKATRLYHAVCVPGTTHQIAGDVAIVVDADVDAE